MFRFLSGEIANPVQYYEEYHNSDSLLKRVRAFSALSAFMWLLPTLPYYVSLLWGISLPELLRSAREELLILFDNSDVSLQKVILYHLGWIRDGENRLSDFQDCVSTLICYANKAKEIPFPILAYVAAIYENHANIDCMIPLRSEAEREMIAKFRREEYLFREDYEKLLTFGLLAAVSHMEPEMTAQVFSLITEIQNRMLSKTRPEWDAIGLHLTLSQTLRNAVLRSSCYSAKEKSAVQEFILRTDLTSARFMAADGQVKFAYVDNSDAGEPPYSCDSDSSTLADVIAYMTARMKRLGFAVPEDDCDIAKRGIGA